MFFEPISIDLPIDYDVDAVEGIITRAAGEINQEGKAAEIYIDEAGEVKVETGVDGLLVDAEALQKTLRRPCVFRENRRWKQKRWLILSPLIPIG